MKLTLSEAARLLGKSTRQLRYLMKAGTIRAVKVEGRWSFDDADLPAAPEQKRARAGKAAELEAAVDEALAPHLRPAGRKSYSVVDLAAFRTGAAACRKAVAALGAGHAAATSLRESVVALAQGCHRFHLGDKASAFQLAREHAAAAVAHLHIEGAPAAQRIAETLERDYLSALVGLLRRQERKERR